MRRPVRRVLAAMVACLTLVAVACGGGSSATGDPGDDVAARADGGDIDGAVGTGPEGSESVPRAGGGDDTTDTETAAGGVGITGDGDGEGADDTATAVPVERGRALPVSPGDPGPAPVSISIESIDVTGAPVRDVGVEPDGQMEIPGAREVGWYRFGSTPGEKGSSVLAAHIAFNGVDGIFRHLDRAEEGDLVTVGFDDGSETTFVVRATEEYFKEELPDDIWDRDGDPRLVLITCGGDFNEQLRSYDSNVVLYAEPVD